MSNGHASAAQRPGRLALESGAVFEGLLFGAAVGADGVLGEVVFNTCMSGYQEVVTDPSYAGQIVVMTHPLIGNYGCRDDTRESSKVWCRGVVVRELASVAYGRSEHSLEAELTSFGVSGLHGVDTRALTRHLRDHGAQRGVIGDASRFSDEQLVALAKAAPDIAEQDLVAEVSIKGAALRWDAPLDATLWNHASRIDSSVAGTRIVVVDLGVKYNQLRALASRGAAVTLVPHDADFERVMSHNPQGVLLSNGPGDPARLPGQVRLAQQLLEKRVPLLGICLGHQVLALAIGATTSKLPFGHHGGNHPVRDQQSGAVHVTSQNHEYQVDGDSISADSGWYVSERNLNDGSVEGLRHRDLPAFSVQYHPEGAPGPQDRASVFDEFLALAQSGELAPVEAHSRAVAASPKPRCVLVLGSGPVVIGQAAEFDYAGTQACRALREENIRVVLVNSNPATIMTDEDAADAVYIEPLTVDVVARIIAIEKPDGLLATMGGQTALNLAIALDEAGVLKEHNVRLLGTSLASIHAAEDRNLFKQLLQRLGEPVPDSATVSTPAEARAFRERIGLPLVVRPAFTLGGTGGGLCDTEAQFEERVLAGLAASPIDQVLVERSLAGWRELEYEVVRDAAGTAIVVCNMENIDPMGVHTGDSIVVAPAQTLTDREHQQLRSAALRIISELGIAGGCNVQFALAPESHEYFVIEVNPRVSRSSALASKATGYPIARVAAKIAAGKRLEEIENAVTGKTCAAFEPALDYCVIKIPRWPFDKFPDGDRRLGTQMKSTGEVMAIERSFEAAVNKALRSLEQTAPLPADLHEPVLLDVANDLRLFAVLQALRDGVSADEVVRRTQIRPWFVDRFAAMVRCEERLRWNGLDDDLLREAKRMALSDQRIAQLCAEPVSRVRSRAAALGLRITFKSVDTCAAEFVAATPYFYSTFETEDESPGGNPPGDSAPVVVLGSGPIRIGQGIEFDYCSVQAANALRAHGVPAVMVNSNPETVSTDFDCSTRLYFEPLDIEAVAAVISTEAARGVVTQFGGQTAINLAAPLGAMGVNVMGTSVASIDAAEDRKSFEKLMRKLEIPQPHGAATTDSVEALAIAERVGYPVLVRPSYVLGGRAMEVVHTPEALQHYLTRALAALPDDGPGRRGSLLIDKYLVGTEVDVDAICDGTTVVVPGLMEHVERAGVHSGDSMAAYPPPHLSHDVADQIVDATVRIALELDIRGVCNIQFVIFGGRAHVIEVNPRASRTVPFLSKVSGVAIVELATKVILGETLASAGWESGLVEAPPLVAVKAPVFSTAKLTAVDTALGPEMKSTGEIMGIDTDLGAALEKAFMATLGDVPVAGGVLCSVADDDKCEALPLLRRLSALGFNLYATGGTASALAIAGIPALSVGKIGHSRPNVLDVIAEGRVHLVINTVSHFDAEPRSAQPDTGAVTPSIEIQAAGRTLKDGYRIRRAAEQRRIPCCTSLDTASALVGAIERRRRGESFSVATVRSYRDGKVGAPS